MARVNGTGVILPLMASSRVRELGGQGVFMPLSAPSWSAAFWATARIIHSSPSDQGHLDEKQTVLMSCWPLKNKVYGNLALNYDKVIVYSYNFSQHLYNLGGIQAVQELLLHSLGDHPSCMNLSI